MGAELTAPDRRALLATARTAIEARLRGHPHAFTGAGSLLEPRGAFVTLETRPGRELRGCVGFVEPLFPLIEAVSRAAVLAAFEDGRFSVVTEAELPRLAIEVSALSPLSRIVPADVEVGRHGLVIRRSGRTGLLLPRVAVEHGWDRERFLEQTCRKAGLPRDAWREPDAELLGFTAEAFGEDEGPERPDQNRKPSLTIEPSLPSTTRATKESRPGRS
ncbi:MAG TPA: AmmeMemoRadiSam system protein A [Vicinamibacteria bacterium]|jgi:AmmeMemoRadiSam system protein A